MSPPQAEIIGKLVTGKQRAAVNEPFVGGIHMKKSLSILLVVLLLTSALGGCGGAPAAPPERGTPTPEETTGPDAAETEAPDGDSPEPGIVADGRAHPSNSGRLRVADGKLCDEKGDPVMLRGVSSNGLITAEGYLN